MPESRTITVQMTVGGTDYYMATEEFVGSNFYSPFVQSLPRIDWSGDGFMKTQAGDLTLTNQPDEDQHPFGYATNWSTLLSNPDQQFLTAIHPGEPKEKRLALWYGFAVIRTISENGLTFDLFENGTESQLSLRRLVGSYPVSSLTAGDPTVLTVDNREMGANTPSDYIKIGDFIQVNNTFSPVTANTDFLVVATSGNNISIDLDSTGTTFATPRVVTNSFDYRKRAQCILNKVLTVPYVAFSEGMTQHNVPRDRYYQDGFFGHYFFTPYQNWYPSTGIGTTTKIFIDGVDQSSNFHRLSGNPINEPTEPHTTERSHSKRPQPIKRFSISSIFYFLPATKPKLQTPTTRLKPGSWLNIPNKGTSSLSWIRSQGTQTISFI